MTTVNSITAKPSIESMSWLHTKSGKWKAALAFPLVIGPVWCLAGQVYGHFLSTLAGFVLLSALIASAITDARRQRIYNWVTYSAFLWAVLINIAASLVSSSDAVLIRAYQHSEFIGPQMLGGVGIGQCLAGAVLCFIITFLGYRLSNQGAGDVKLATVIGAFLGVQYGVFAVLYCYIVAAIAIVAWATWSQGPMALLQAGFRTIGTFLGPLWPFQPTTEDRGLLLKPIPLGPYFAIGTLLVVLEIVPV